MLTKEHEKRNQLQMLCIDDLVPKDHLLRKIEKAIDWTFIYELVEATRKCIAFSAPETQDDCAMFYQTMAVLHNGSFTASGVVEDLKDIIVYIDFSNIFNRRGNFKKYVDRINKAKDMFRPEGISLDLGNGNYLGRFTYDILKNHYALNRVFVILARGYMWERDEPDAPRARRALCAWCSLPEDVKPKTKKEGQDRVSFPELHAEFPELVDEDGAGWFYNHVHNIIAAVLDNTDKNTKAMVENALLLLKGFDEEWCKKLMQYQASPYSKTTKGAWNCRFDDVVAEAKNLGRLQNKDFDLPAETQKMLEDATPKGVPKYVLPELAKYYIANKPEDSDKVVLPVSNFSAYFGHTSFDRKWLKILPEDVIVREEYAGVCRYRMIIPNERRFTFFKEF